MLKNTEDTVKEITKIIGTLATLLPKIREMINNFKKHAAVARRGDNEVVERTRSLIETLENMKRLNIAMQTNAMILYRSGVYPPASKLILLLNGQTRHLQRLIGFVQIYGDSGSFHQIETELTELGKLYEETLVFLRKEEEPARAAA